MRLNPEQRKIIQSEPNGQVLIKGVAGSGKTTVAVYKIPLLINNYCSEHSDGILFVTYAKMLVNYVQHIYDSVKDEELYKSILKVDPDRKIEIKGIDSLIYGLFKQLMKKRDIKIKTYVNENEYIKRAIHKVRDDYPDEKILDDFTFIKSELDWIRACRYDNWEIYSTIARKGRTTKKAGENTYNLHKESDRRKAIFEILIHYNQIIEKEGAYGFKDKPLVVLSALESGELNPIKYTHIVIDESQDLSRVQLEIIKNIYDDTKDYSSIYFIADTAQSIYDQSWLSYNSFKSIGFSMAGRAKVLDKNYRTTYEIAQAAYSLVEKDLDTISNENYVKPSSINRHGDFPIVKGFSSDEDENKFISDAIYKLAEKNSYSEICVVARTKSQLKNIENSFAEARVPCEIVDKKDPNFKSNTVKLMTMHAVKGLEFKIIFVSGLKDGIVPYKSKSNGIDEESMERRLLYVSMTRAKEKLYMTYSGQESKFIKDIDSEWIKSKEISIFERVDHIGIKNFKFRDKISDIYGEEEIVRQWAIQELHSKLGYKYEDMSIEYRVQNFSKTGYADVAIKKHCSDSLWIIGEIKSEKKPLIDAIKQLRSYMNAEENVPYGFATNGIETKMYKREGSEIVEIEELPRYRENETFNQNRIYFDLSNKSEIEMNYDELGKLCKLMVKGEEIDGFTTQKIEVLGEVAAGYLKSAQQEWQESIELPRKFIKLYENCFLLKVKGDSMIDVGIRPKDYVLVRKQAIAENRDIVIGVVNEEATMKRYVPMGENILLMPENKNYEPIMVKADELIVNGKVIGVLKN
ncbi:MAG: UvrD-helicase domain-containing protein [Tissierellales bacterium]|nr:UvrD-helicase domain-containing protein [Tissierellales bacterium]